MSLPKILILLVIVIVVGAGVAIYWWSVPDAYAPTASDQTAAYPPSAPSEEQELGAIPVDDLGTEMQDIDAELAK